jgi:hypothetical protein
MLQAHTFLWNYLWVAPNIFLLVLGFLIWRRGLATQFPAFCAFAILSAIGHLALYVADVVPSVSPANFWRVDWVRLSVESVLKFAVISEIFSRVFGSYISVVRLGRILIRSVGVVLVLASALAAAYAPQGSKFGIISGSHLLEQTTDLIETGLLAFIFLFTAYFRLKLEPRVFGISIGIAFSACVHLGAWAIAANSSLANPKRIVLDLLFMGSFHISVLIWYYYLLLPHKVATKSVVPLPENNLAVWNRELERLIHS